MTGANGFVGHHLVQYLVTSTCDEIIAVGGPNFGNDESFPLKGKVVWDNVDVVDGESVQSLVQRYLPDQIYHLAASAMTHGTHAGKYYDVNVLGTYNLARSLLGVCGEKARFLFVSSATVYGYSENCLPLDENQPLKPRNEYGASKVQAEKILGSLREQGLSLYIARPFNHTGPGQNKGFVIPDILLQVYEQSKLIQTRVSLKVGPLNSIRDFTDVRDVVRAYYLIMNYGDLGEVYNVASGQVYSIGQVVDLVCKVAGVTNFTIQSDEILATTREQSVLVGSFKKIQDLNWRTFFSFDETLNDMWNSYPHTGGI